MASRRYRFLPAEGDAFFLSITGRPERVSIVVPWQGGQIHDTPTDRKALFTRTVMGPGVVEYVEVNA